MTVVEFPKSLAAANRVERRVARSAAASKPRNSNNGTPEERAAKTALRKEKRLAWFQDFGLRLRVTRSALGITEVEAAAACLITLRTYRRREAGMPFTGTWHEGLSSFVEMYDLTYDWMLCGEGNMYIDRAAKALGDQRRQSRPVLTVVSKAA